jgi:ribose transport system substrate-binding protein
MARTPRQNLLEGGAVKNYSLKVALGAFAVAVVAAASLLVSGASGSPAKAKSSGPWTIGVSNGYYGNAARVQLAAEAKAYAALPSVKGKIKSLIFNNAGTSVAAQISAVDGLIAQHVDAILLDSNSLTGLNPTIAAAHKAGIVVVAMNDQVSSPLAYQVQTVGKAFGAALMQGFVKLMHGKGNILVERGLAGNAVDAAEASGFNGVLAKNPGIHVLNVSYPQWDDAQAQKITSDLLSRYNNIDGVFTEGGMEQGVVRAYVAAHRKFVPVAGTDENGFACQLKKYHAQGLAGVQIGSALYAYALSLKTALSVLGGAHPQHLIPVSWVVWNTAQSVAHCQPGLSPSLFLGVASPKDGINVTAQQVEKYMH